MLKVRHTPFLRQRTVVDIGFTQTVYTVSEGDAFVDITFGIINNVIISGSSDPVEVTFTATADSATGK